MDGKITLKEIECSNCGGTIHFVPTTQLIVCNYCGTTFNIEHAKNDEIEQPDGIVPFKVTKEQFDSALMNWLIQGDYTPDDILNNSNFKNVSGLYMPFYLVQGTYNGSWSALSGIDRQEQYTEYVKKSRWVGNREVEYTEPETRYRTVTDWTPVTGGVNGNFIFLGLAANVVKKLPDNVALYFETTGWQEGELKPFDPRVISGFGIENFDLSQNEVIQLRIDPKLNNKIYSECYGMVPGSHAQNLTFNAQKQIVSVKKIFLPYWVVSFNYKDKIYTCAVDGQYVTRIIGNKPVDDERKNKIKSYFTAFKAMIGLYIAGLIIFTFTDYRFTYTHGMFALFGIIVVALIGGWAQIQKDTIIKKSQKLRMELLEKYKQTNPNLVPTHNIESSVMIETPNKPINHNSISVSNTNPNSQWSKPSNSSNLIEK